MASRPLFCYYSRKEVGTMALWRNLQNMDERTYWVMKRGFQLSALLLAIGCQAIRLGELITADLFRQLSASALLLTVAATTYIELHQNTS